MKKAEMSVPNEKGRDERERESVLLKKAYIVVQHLVLFFANLLYDTQKRLVINASLLMESRVKCVSTKAPKKAKQNKVKYKTGMDTLWQRLLYIKPWTMMFFFCYKTFMLFQSSKYNSW